MGPNLKKRTQGSTDDRIGPILKIGLNGSTDGRFGPNFKTDLQGHLCSFEVILSKLTFLNYHSLFFVVQPPQSLVFLTFSLFYFSLSCFMSHDQNRMHQKRVGLKLRSYWPVHSWRFNGNLNSRPKFGTLSASIHPLLISL